MTAPAPAGGSTTADGEPAPRTAILHGGHGPPSWGRGGGAVALALPAPGSEPTASGAAALADIAPLVECVLVDVDTVDPLATARRVHAADADVQVVLVVATEEGRRALERAMLFAPGLGEVWLASPTEVAAALAERAAGVTRQRRKFRRTRERMERERLAASPQRAARAIISDAYLAYLLQVLPDPVFSVDTTGRILSANPAADRLFAGAGSGLVGMPLDAALGTSDASAVQGLLARSAAGAARAELSFRRADGTAGQGELLMTRVAVGEPAFHAAVLHDLTEQLQARRQLEDQAVELEIQASMLQEQTVELEQTNDELVGQRTELEAALESRGRFYAAMSHELRTPVNAVIGYTGLALEGLYGPLAPALRDALTRSQRAATHLHELVDDVLDLAKIEAGRIEVAREAVDPSALAEDILHSIGPTADASATPISLECCGELTAPLMTDPRRVRQILLNLLGNALKFGAGAAVTLRCLRVPQGIAFSVTDQGPGIPHVHQHRVFEEFVQLDPHAHRGTGLGLAISRRLAELLGGTLTLQSEPGRGSTFTLTLPAA